MAEVDDGRILFPVNTTHFVALDKLNHRNQAEVPFLHDLVCPPLPSSSYISATSPPSTPKKSGIVFGQMKKNLGAALSSAASKSNLPKSTPLAPAKKEATQADDALPKLSLPPTLKVKEEKVKEDKMEEVDVEEARFKNPEEEDDEEDKDASESMDSKEESEDEEDSQDVMNSRGSELLPILQGKFGLSRSQATEMIDSLLLRDGQEVSDEGLNIMALVMDTISHIMTNQKGQISEQHLSPSSIKAVASSNKKKDEMLKFA